MPPESTGHIYTTATGYGIRYRDAHGQHRRAGFSTKRDARQWLRAHLDAGLRPDRMTFAQLVDAYLDAHAVGREASTITTLRERLKRPRDAFGEPRPPTTSRRARSRSPRGKPRCRSGPATASCRRSGRRSRPASAGATCATNPAKLAGRNPQPRAPRSMPFTRGEIDALAVELGPLYGPLVIFAAETGLRPAEWMRARAPGRSTRRRASCIVARSFSRGVREGLRQDQPSAAGACRSRRARSSALDALPPRLDTPLLFPGPRRQAPRPSQLARARVDPGARRRGHPAPSHLRPAAHRDQPLARGWPRQLRGRPVDGNVGAHDRRDLRSPRGLQRGRRAQAPGRLCRYRAARPSGERPRDPSLTAQPCGFRRHGRYWARTSDPQLVELVLSQLS